MRLKFRPRLHADVADEELLWQTVSAGFAQKRKTILNNLRSAPEDLRALIQEAGGAAVLLEAAGLDPRLRAEALTQEEWARLTKTLAPRGR
jgi:16S rRNA (adenine1518-N6/adenine1519-N6)-dimethyltransferase